MDDLNDPETKLRDGVALLDAKVEAVGRYAAGTGKASVNPVMLVVCESIDQAKEVEALIGSRSFFDGRYRDAVLRIDSEVPDASLAALADVEEPDSPVRIIVSVGMLKEGWDVANVYVIASLRPSISEILTEQTLGRGLRLPWGEYTDVELLDTLEVLAHERYEEMLAKAKALKEELIDWRTVTRPDHPEQIGESLQSPLIAALTGGAPRATEPDYVEPQGYIEVGSASGSASAGNLSVVSFPNRLRHLEEAANTVAALTPRVTGCNIAVPVLEMIPQTTRFSLTDITDVDPFRTLGRQLRLDPEDVLRRTLLSARSRLGRDGITRIELDTRPASEQVVSQGVLLSPGEARPELIRRLALAPQVPNRANEMQAAEPLVDAFLEGLGDAVEHLGAYIDRAAGGLLELVGKVATLKASNPDLREVIRLQPFAPTRSSRPDQSTDRLGEFRPRVGYRGWARSMHEENWFDSRPERTVANALDASNLVACWARLLRNDLPILWNGMGNLYNPDFLVVEEATSKGSGLHWLVEVKSEKELATFDVRAKREAAERWAAKVTADPALGGVKWRYLLLGEVDIVEAKGGWRAMRARYSGRA
jgi:type III restriction enzyme